ncbi:MAG: DUF4082 domain-containing protein, partial [Planctomycetota bacterium]
MPTGNSKFVMVALLTGLSLMLAAGVANATNYPMNQQSPVTAGFNSPTTPSTGSQWGWRFRCNSSGITVTQLGCWFPDSSSVLHTVRLYDFTTTNLLATATPAVGAGWRWANLSTPVSLVNGSDYVIQGFTNTRKYYLNTSPASWMPTGTISWVEARYNNGTSTPVFPTSSLAQYGSGVVDIGYITAPPAAPATITVPATSSTGIYTVSWAASVGASNYDLQEDTNSGFTSATTVYSGANTSFQVTGKTNGTYYYRVRATNPAGNSAWTVGSNPCVVTLVAPSIPGSITVPTSSVSGNYTVNWAASTGAWTYDLQEATNSSFTGATTVYTGANTSYGVTGKTTGTFWYRVRATNAAGSSGWRPSTNGCQIVAPATPASITVPATSVTGNFTVNWAASTGAAGYDLQEANNSSFTGATTVYTGPSTSYNVTGKTTGTWWYRVRALGVAGNSGWRNSGNGCQMVAPAAPTVITVPASDNDGNYTVSWNASSGATNYDLEEDTNAGFTAATLVYSGSNLSFGVT